MVAYDASNLGVHILPIDVCDIKLALTSRELPGRELYWWLPRLDNARRVVEGRSPAVTQMTEPHHGSNLRSLALPALAGK